MGDVRIAGPSIGKSFEQRSNLSKHAFDVLHYFGICHPKGDVAPRLEQSVTAMIGLSFMGPPIDFNDQSLLRAKEIRNEWWDRYLAPEFET